MITQWRKFFIRRKKVKHYEKTFPHTVFAVHDVTVCIVSFLY